MNRTCRNLYLILLLSFSFISTSARSRYLTYQNSFGALNNTQSIISDNLLITDNVSTVPIIAVDTFNVSDSQFTCSLRVANLHNKEGKSYKCIDPATKKSKRILNPSWGMVWNYIDDSNYYATIVHAYNTNLHDLLDERLMKIEIIQVKDGKEHILKEETLKKGIDLQNDYNVFILDYDGKCTTISIGNKIPIEIARFTDITFAHQTKIGLYIGCGAMTKVERLTVTTRPIFEHLLQTKWNKDNISSYLQSCKDTYEGIWDVYDHSLNFRKLRMGGKYQVALIANDKSGYDIIYIDGAKVNGKKWKCGMLKGQLIPTPFSDNYSLVWYDAMMKPFNDECYAVFEDARILTLYFPAENGKLRFTRFLDTKIADF